MDAMVHSASAFSIFGKAKQAVLSVVASVNLSHVTQDVADSWNHENVSSAGDATHSSATPSRLGYCTAVALGPALFPVLLPVAVGSYMYNRCRSADTTTGVTTEQISDEELLISKLDDSSAEPDSIQLDLSLQLGLSLRKHRLHGYLSLSVAGNGLDKAVLVRKGGRGSQPNLYRVAIFPSRILELKYDDVNVSRRDFITVCTRGQLSRNMIQEPYIAQTKCLRYEIARATSATIVDFDASDRCWYDFCASVKVGSTIQRLDWEQYTADQAIQATTFWLKWFSHKVFHLNSMIDLTLIEQGPASPIPILERPTVHNAKPDMDEAKSSGVRPSMPAGDGFEKNSPIVAPEVATKNAVGQVSQEPARQEPKKKVSRFDSIFKSAVYQKEAIPQTTKQVDGVKFYEENISARLAELDKENSFKASNAHAHISPPNAVKREPKFPAQAVKPSVDNKGSGQPSPLRPVAANTVNGRTLKPRGYRRISYPGYRERIAARTAKQSPKVLEDGKKSAQLRLRVANQMQDQSAAPVSPVQPAVEQVEKAPKQPASKSSLFFKSSPYANKVGNNVVSTDEPFTDHRRAEALGSKEHKGDTETVPAYEKQAVFEHGNVNDQLFPGLKTHTGEVGAPENQSPTSSSPTQSANRQADEAPRKPVSKFSAFFNSSRYVDKVSKNAVRADGPFAEFSTPKAHDLNKDKENAVTPPSHKRELAWQNQAVSSYVNINRHGSYQSKELDVRAHGGLVWVPPERQPLSSFPPAPEIVDPNWDECDRNPRCRRASDALLADEPPHPLVDRIVDNVLGLNRIQELGEVHQIEDVDLADSQPLGNLTRPATPNDQCGSAKAFRASRPGHGAVGDSRPMIRRVKKVPNLREPGFTEHSSNTPNSQEPKIHPGLKDFAALNANSWDTTGLKIIKHKRNDSGVVLNVLEEDELELAKTYFREANALFRTRMENIRLRSNQPTSSPDSSDLGSSPPAGIPVHGNKPSIQSHIEAQQPFFSALDRLQRRNARVFTVDANGFDSSDFGSSPIGPTKEESRKQAEASTEFQEENAAMLAGNYTEEPVEAQQPTFNTLELLHLHNEHLHGFDPRDASYFPGFDGVWIEPSDNDLQEQAEKSVEVSEAGTALLHGGWNVEFWRDCIAHAERHNMPRLRVGSIGVQG